jgi:hypothetical protein
MGRMCVEDVGEQDAEDIIWTWECGSGGRLEKTA